MEKPYSVKLYNTYTRKLETLEPLEPSKVGLYCCGPTVYDFQHIGNFKTFTFEDVLVRMLRYAGYDVRHVINITDVGHLTSDADEGEDKMIVAMRREGKSSQEIAQFYTDKFFEDWDKLNLVRPDVVCKATDHIQEMINLVKRIEEQGYAYQTGGNVYFDVTKFSNYGKLAKLDIEKLKAGARIDVDPNKRSPHDFVLWFTQSKFENQELQWDSPWGRGYPGWHIECSAMSMKYLGDQFDIHCGGIDHIPVHHTNEIAQSEAATGKPWVKIWMHSEFILIDDDKMSKSKGGFLVLDDISSNGFEPAAYRFLLLGAHYRAHLNFSWKALENAARNLKKLKNAVVGLKAETAPTAVDQLSAAVLKYENEFRTALCNDLNTPQALAVTWKALADKALSAGDKLQLIYKIDTIFGLGVEAWEQEEIEITPELQELLDRREQARTDKDWTAADQLRTELAALGFVVEDSPAGPKLKRA